MQSEEMSQQLLQLLDKEFPALKQLSEEEYFTDAGVLDSFDYIRLITTLQAEFGLNIPDNDLVEENFGTKRAIANYLQARAQSAGL